ncbi:hypothetical protein CCR79_13235 [Halorhodospira halophila]|nr:hypothetical protein [Halorhodospira halophila]
MAYTLAQTSWIFNGEEWVSHSVVRLPNRELTLLQHRLHPVTGEASVIADSDFHVGELPHELRPPVRRALSRTLNEHPHNEQLAEAAEAIQQLRTLFYDLSDEHGPSDPALDTAYAQRLRAAGELSFSVLRELKRARWLLVGANPPELMHE